MYSIKCTVESKQTKRHPAGNRNLMIFSINLKHILVYVFPFLNVSDTSTISVIYLCVLIHVFHYSGFRNCGWRCHLYHLHWIYCSSSRNPIISPSAANKLWTHGWQKREDFSSDSTYFDAQCLKITQNVAFFKNSPKLTIFQHFNELLSTQNENVARFTRNAKSDFLGRFSDTVSM